MKKLIDSMLVVFGIVFILQSCSKTDDIQPDNFESLHLKSKYDSIRSYPGGSGLFILTIDYPENLSGNISFQLNCDPLLNASLTNTDINSNDSVFELLIEPYTTIQVKDYSIRIISSIGNYRDTAELTVSILDWSSSGLNDLVSAKLNAFDEWLCNNFPEFNFDNQSNWEIYATYPEILIVEHYTLLNDNYEFRICNHAMIPPYDWSMVWIRKRNELEAFFAARQDSTNGSIYEIPVNEYPKLFGY